MSGVAGWRDGDVAERALFNQPRGLAVIGGVLYVADSGNHAVRAVDLSGPAVSTAAGDPAKTGAAELRDGNGGAARFWFPAGLAADALAEILYVADSGNGALRRLDVRAGNRVSTLAVDALNSAAAASAGTGGGAGTGSGGGSSTTSGGGDVGSGGGAPTPVFLALLVPLAILRASRVFDFPKNQI
jgi:DNA-binding beta-propeller fold protein YncE